MLCTDLYARGREHVTFLTNPPVSTGVTRSSRADGLLAAPRPEPNMTCAKSLHRKARDQTGGEEFSSGEATRPGLRTSGMALMRHYPAEQV